MEHAVLRVMRYRYELDNPYQYVLNIARYDLRGQLKTLTNFHQISTAKS